MEEVLTKFQPGVLPHCFVVLTFANLSVANGRCTLSLGTHSHGRECVAWWARGGGRWAASCLLTQQRHSFVSPSSRFLHISAKKVARGSCEGKQPGPPPHVLPSSAWPPRQMVQSTQDHFAAGPGFYPLRERLPGGVFEPGLPGLFTFSALLNLLIWRNLNLFKFIVFVGYLEF